MGGTQVVLVGGGGLLADPPPPQALRIAAAKKSTVGRKALHSRIICNIPVCADLQLERSAERDCVWQSSSQYRLGDVI